MRCFIFFMLLSVSNHALAQKFNFPKLMSKTSLPALTLPENWSIIDTALGDLNADRLEDLALVLEYKHEVDEERAYGNYAIELIKETQKPRILAIYFKEKNGKYRLILQNNDFILRSQEGGQLGDPLKAIRIDENKLMLSFEGGNDWRWKLNYDFQYQHSDWNLVNANNVYYHKDSGEMVGKQYDFAERTIRTVIGSIFRRNISNYTEDEVFVFGQVRSLKDFKKPWTWEVTKDNYL